MSLLPHLRGFFICKYAIIILAFNLDAADIPRARLSLDDGWKFHLGDDWQGALNLTKAGTSTGPAAEKFDDSSWRTLQLPHDWAVELPFDPSADRNHGFKAIGPGFPENNVGWYRRTFELPKEDEGKRIRLTFDGVYRDATVWVNGWLVGRHESGYYPFREDISDVVRFGGKNTVTVRANAAEAEGWFYEGAGIYRHVWLEKTAPVSLAPDGIFVSSRFKDNMPSDNAAILVEATVKNTLSAPAEATVRCEVISPEGKSVAKFEKSVPVAGGSDQSLSLASDVAAPVLWSPESPKLYTLVTSVSLDGKEVDLQSTPFGIRTVAMDKERGFLLNGQPYEIKGTCNHQDHAGVGAAIPDALQSFRVARLKEMGCNAYRTSHNPATPELLDACDRLGMIVMDENRLLGSDSSNLGKWGEQIRRDRNHPSVCIWSVANEEGAVQSTAQGAKSARAMQDYAKRLDPTRPVTYASAQGNTSDGINGVIEVRGWNYHVGKDMDSYHAKHPDQPNIGTEQASVVGTRGIYTDDKERGYVSARDDHGKDTAEGWWSYFADRPWLSGAFIWTGFDYRGEPTPYGWPCISSHFGVLDTCGFPKDSFYYYRSWWTTNPTLHLLPHWNWPGKEGQEVHVDALSNCREVELFINGQSLGKQAMRPNSKLSWNVKYEPGTLSARGFDQEGKVIAETKIETTGEPVALKLTRDLTGMPENMKADGEDLAIYTVSAVDSKGRDVPTAQNKIRFELAGPGKIIGVGNGDPSCHEPDVFLIPDTRTVRVDGWRYKVVDSFPTNSETSSPMLCTGVDESGWNMAKRGAATTIGDLDLFQGKKALYRAHVMLSQEDLDAAGARLLFEGCSKHGWYFVNGQLVGESRKWEERPVFDVARHLHPGENVIAVGIQHDGKWGGLNPNVNLEFVPKASAANWSRSLFNGLAQVIVQSAKNPGEIKLTASAENLKPANATVKTHPAPIQQSVP